MARFRPSRLFRRLSSRSDGHANNTKSRSRSQRSPSPPNSAAIPSPPLPASAPVPRRLQTSSSLPRLRKRSGTQGTVKSVKSGEVERAREDSVPEVPEAISEVRESLLLADTTGGEEVGSEWETASLDKSKSSGTVELAEQKEAVVSTEELRLEDVESVREKPIVVIEHPTPDVTEEVRGRARHVESGQASFVSSTSEVQDRQVEQQSASSDILQATPTDTRTPVRRPSIIDISNAKIVKTLLDAPIQAQDRSTSDSSAPPTTTGTEYFERHMPNMANMLHRKIWVKRPGASATLVQIKEDDLVDDVRDMILRKYANSLGRTFDAPDMNLHIISRPEQGMNRTERLLGPEEEMCHTIDQMYPGGQTVDDALIINVPQRRTPKPSPRIFQDSAYQRYQMVDDYRPLENGTDYFPPMPAVIPATIPHTSSSHESHSSARHQSVAVPQTAAHPTADHPRSISVLNTGQIPPLPSPGAQSRRHQHRPKYQRQPTSSPTILSHPTAGAVAVAPPAANAQPHLVHRQSARPRLDSSASEAPHRPNGIAVPVPPPLPTPPAPEAAPTNKDGSAPPTPSAAVAPVGVTGAHMRAGRPKKPRKPDGQNASGNAVSSRRKKESSSASSPHPSSGIASMLDASVPPINVLIVEDNHINLRILEGLMKRLKVRWQTAMNGQIAVDKWKAGGFHLVLMDIQMPVMNGIQATKEIRRLERANSIGVFSSASPDEDERGPNGEARPPSTSSKDAEKEKEKQDDSLPGLSDGLIKSPVIIVALTASSLQSDRHEALAAGCNDFLTKPVNFVWLERKVKEWGCMQALIDFDGWRKWKEYAAKEEEGKSEEQKAKEREKEERERVKAEKLAKLQEKQAKAKEERKKRVSINAQEGGVVGSGPGSPGLVPKREEGDAAGANGAPLEKISSATLRPGKEVLGEAGLDLG